MLYGKPLAVKLSASKSQTLVLRRILRRRAILSRRSVCVNRNFLFGVQTRVYKVILQWPNKDLRLTFLINQTRGTP